jgi:hypothetical protein
MIAVMTSQDTEHICTAVNQRLCNEERGHEHTFLVPARYIDVTVSGLATVPNSLVQRIFLRIEAHSKQLFYTKCVSTCQCINVGVH